MFMRRVFGLVEGGTSAFPPASVPARCSWAPPRHWGRSGEMAVVDVTHLWPCGGRQDGAARGHSGGRSSSSNRVWRLLQPQPTSTSGGQICRTGPLTSEGSYLIARTTVKNREAWTSLQPDSISSPHIWSFQKSPGIRIRSLVWGPLLWDQHFPPYPWVLKSHNCIQFGLCCPAE